jgi:hypothetical protein
MEKSVDPVTIIYNGVSCVRQEIPLRKIIIASALLLAGCGNKQMSDATASSEPTNVTQSQSTSQSVTSPKDANQSPALVTTAASQSTQQAQPGDQQPYAPMPAYPTEEPPKAVSVYIDFPTEQPDPVEVDWAPPPMLVDTPPEEPSDDDVWVGGFWVWEGSWVWAHGRWSRPPHHGYRWHNPYYEHRGDAVVFINGFWSPTNYVFVPPPPEIRIPRAEIALGVNAGRRPEGPPGVFVPPPPGSRYGLIVPAPLGTPPAAIVGAPPMDRPGMHIIANGSIATNANVSIVAPANSTTDGRAFSITAPTLPHLAAGQHPLVNITAPAPIISQPIASYRPGNAPPVLPPPQSVHAGTTSVASILLANQHANSTPTEPIATQPVRPIQPGPVYAPVSSPAQAQALEAPRTTTTASPPSYRAPQPVAQEPRHESAPIQATPILQREPAPKPVLEERAAPMPRPELAPQHQLEPQPMMAQPVAPHQTPQEKPASKVSNPEEKEKR